VLRSERAKTIAVAIAVEGAGEGKYGGAAHEAR
jgi:hypothetical protein